MVKRVTKLISKNAAMIYMACWNVKTPMIIGPTKPPNDDNVLTSAIPAGAVDSEKKNVR